jgi:hypothetical protein
MQKQQQTDDSSSTEEPQTVAGEPRKTDADRPKEIGGRSGPEPTRYGDWEKAGRCIDF